MELTINVYDEKGEVVKVSKANSIDIKFGTIRSLMELLKIDDMNNTMDILKVVYGAWDQITSILGQIFPDMEYDDWNNIKLNELLPTVLLILKDSFGQMLVIPSDSKNPEAE